jgi:hypothetical protein
MRECFQFKSMSILDHGLSVRSWYLDLLRYLDGHGTELSWRMPSWIDAPIIKEELDWTDDKTIELYQIYHDCGKPLCRELDAEGRQHFPGHAAVSRTRWLECSDGSPAAQLIGSLIGSDMLVHTLSPKESETLSNDPWWPVLLLTGLCELHSNAQMFGGIESTSFKIKFKQLERLGKKVIERIS